jgi:hypothetical protein
MNTPLMVDNLECIFCLSEGPFSSVEHIIPESLGNDDLILRGEVCDSCQKYFGKEIELFVLGKTPLAFWRTYLGIKTKKGKNPQVDLSQPATQKGSLPSVHDRHDNVGFTYYEDGSVSIDITNPQILREILEGERNQFVFVFTPKVLHVFGRFLCKVGIELLCLRDRNLARSKDLDKARRYARFGEFDGLWPIFHFSKGTIDDLKELRIDDLGFEEEVKCYSYFLFEYQKNYLLFLFSMGTDYWVVSLNDPFPTPVIREAFPDNKLELIWYSKEQYKGIF